MNYSAFFILILLFAFQEPAYVKKANKTINDSIFVVGDIIKIPTILFFPPTEYGEMNTITKDSLNAVGDFLLKYPNLTIEVTNHTDYRGSEEYNMRLSQEKARACVNFLTREKKIEPTKITPKGCGEAFLLIDEEEIKKAKTKKEKEALHQLNNRTELVVTGVD